MDFLYQVIGEGWKLWLSIGIIFFLAEGANPGTFALFFAGIGALTTAAACRVSPAVTGSGIYQLLIFAAMSLSSLVLLRRRILRSIQKNGAQLDGPEAYVGKHAKTITILGKDGLETGRILFEGTEWPAEPSEDCQEEIPAGSAVEVVKMEGLTIQVRPVRK